MGNNAPTREREIKVSNASSRLTKQETAALKQQFDRLQEGMILTQDIFRADVLGYQVPEVISHRLYDMFASKKVDQVFVDAAKNPPGTQQAIMDRLKTNQFGQLEEDQRVMTFEDFVAFFVVFKKQDNKELGHVVFQMLCLQQYLKRKMQKKDATTTQANTKADQSDTSQIKAFRREDLQLLNKQILGFSDKELSNFYLKSRFDYNIAIKQEDFIEQYAFFKTNSVVAWVPKIVTGFNSQNMNINVNEAQDEENSKLSGMSEQRLQKEAKDQGIEPEEMANINEFHNSEIKGQEAKDVVKVFTKMFKDIESQKLRKHLMNAISLVQSLSIEFITDMVIQICKTDDDDEEVYNYLFDVFAKHQPYINKQALNDFTEIFGLPKGTFNNATKMSLETFTDIIYKKRISIAPLRLAKPMITAMVGLNVKDAKEEKAAILAALNGNKHLNNYIYENLPRETEFFIINKDFWDSWCRAINWHEDTEIGLKFERKLSIDNRGLLEQYHQFRMRDLVYKQDFVLVPKYVFFPLSKWYPCDKVITRQVIKYPNARRRDDIGSMMSSHYSGRFMMSSQKFYNTKEECFDEDLVHRDGDFVFELEVSPRIVYLGKINEQGLRPHKNAIQNKTVDALYLKKTLKSETIPFEELELSKKTTFNQLLITAAKLFGENPKKGRLLIDEVVLHGPKLYMTLGDFGIPIGQLIYAEFVNANNEWPTDIAKKSKQKDSERDTPVGATKSQIRTVGLHNLGNTCYMNSALQVITNLQIFYEYFVSSNLFQKQMNMQNTSGYQGDLVEAFANLMKSMYRESDECTAIIPRHFKQTVAECSDQFQGFDQQDSQEFLSFLVDGLHEELNLRTTKPFVANPDSKDRDLSELSLEQWSNGLRRDWSLIYFTFYGQMRSSLSCKSCKLESTTFDIFSQMALSLPEPTQQTLSIVIYRIQNKIKDILNNRTLRDEAGNVTLQGLQRLDTQTDLESESGMFSSSSVYQKVGQNRVTTSQSNRDRRHLQQFTDSYNYMTNDQPIHVHIKVENDIRIRDLIVKIAQIREVNIESSQLKTELILFQLNKERSIRGLFNPNSTLSNYNLNGAELLAIETLTQIGRDTIKNFYAMNPTFIENHPESLLKALMYSSSKQEMNINNEAPNKKRAGRKDLSQTQVIEENDMNVAQPQKDSTGKFKKNTFAQQKLDRYTIFNQLYANHEQMSDFSSSEKNVPIRFQDDDDSLPDNIFIVCYHRRFYKKDEVIFQDFVPQLIGSPIIISIPRGPCGRRLYDEVWAVACNLLKPNCRYHRPSLRWWERRDWKTYIKKGDGIFKPFILKTVDRQGYACSKCHWTEKCSGCIIEPNDAPVFVEDLINNSFLAIEWNGAILTEFYNQTANDVVEHSSVFERQNGFDQSHNYSTLDEALIKFHSRELLENHVNCVNCKANKPHTKRLEIYKLPPILIIQLKRFRQVGNQWRKLQTLIDFPVNNLNMAQYIGKTNAFDPDSEVTTQYDLHGIVNHYGTLGYGHYASFVKNQFDQTWYKYDDDVRTEIKEEQLEKESAYLLFYIRKDVIGKQASYLMPNIETSFFPGKPVVINSSSPPQEGFITEVLGPDSFVVKVQSETTPKRVALAELSKEKDKNEIQYNANDMKNIEMMKTQKTVVPIPKKTNKCCEKSTKKQASQSFLKTEPPQIKIASENKPSQQIDNISASNMDSQSPDKNSDISGSPLRHQQLNMSAERKAASSVEPITRTKITALN